MPTLDPRAEDVLLYWFGARDSEQFGQMRMSWFRGGPEADTEIRERFAGLHTHATQGALDDWRDTADGCLALVIVLDQFSRNLHRGTAGAFAADPKALGLAQQAIERGFDAQVLPVQRWFFYLPFEHAEDLDAQRRSVELFSALPDEPSRKVGVDYAKEHLDVIERFGRFPHRNPMLGRTSTPEELAWLAGGGARFG